MELARVIGQVTATTKAEELRGVKLMAEGNELPTSLTVRYDDVRYSHG